MIAILLFNVQLNTSNTKQFAILQELYNKNT